MHLGILDLSDDEPRATTTIDCSRGQILTIIKNHLGFMQYVQHITRNTAFPT